MYVLCTLYSLLSGPTNALVWIIKKTEYCCDSLWSGRSEVRNPEKTGDIIFNKTVQTASGFHPASISIHNGVLSRGKEVGARS